MEEEPKPQIIYSSYTKAQKRANEKWRNENLEYSREYGRNYSKKYYETHKEEKREKSRQYYHRKKAERLKKEEEAKLKSQD